MLLLVVWSVSSCRCWPRPSMVGGACGGRNAGTGSWTLWYLGILLSWPISGIKHVYEGNSTRNICFGFCNRGVRNQATVRLLFFTSSTLYVPCYICFGFFLFFSHIAQFIDPDDSGSQWLMTMEQSQGNCGWFSRAMNVVELCRLEFISKYLSSSFVCGMFCMWIHAMKHNLLAECIGWRGRRCLLGASREEVHMQDICWHLALLWPILRPFQRGQCFFSMM